jgi:hypothetical protein
MALYFDTNGNGRVLYLTENAGVQTLHKEPPYGPHYIVDSGDQLHNPGFSRLFTFKQPSVYNTILATMAFIRIEENVDDFINVFTAHGYKIHTLQPMHPFFKDFTNEVVSASTEPECKCRYLLDGHDRDCQYIKWKKASF